MLRSRILSAATAAVLMLGISVGGVGAAFAETDDGLAPAAVEIALRGVTSTEPAGNELTQSESAAVFPAVEPATEDHDTDVKVFVCKYVGTPGVDEVLATGQNPVSVSVNAIPDYQGAGSYFACCLMSRCPRDGVR